MLAHPPVRPGRASAAVIAGLALLATTASADSWMHREELHAPDAQAGALFGSATATDGVRLVVGAPYDDERAPDAGAVYVYARTGTEWVLEQKLTASDAAPGDHFGTAVAIEGGRLAVGANQLFVGTGKAYVFEHASGTWVEDAVLVPTTSQTDARFGESVDLSSDLLVVGSPFLDGTYLDAGAAYVYRRVAGSWTLDVRLTPPTLTSPRQMGASVSVDGDLLAVGAPHGQVGGVQIYWWTGTSWYYEELLLPQDPVYLGRFGESVSLEGQRLAVGQSRPTVPAGAPGSVLYFERVLGVGWLPRQQLVPANGQPQDEFGKSVALHGTRLLVGAPSEDALGPDSGAAYLYEQGASGWTLLERFTAHDGAPGDLLGDAVALHGTTLVLGAYATDDGGNGTGSAYLLEERANPISICSGDGSGTSCPCGNPGAPGRGCANSLGVGALVEAAGDASVANDTLVLTARFVPTSAPVLFLQGSTGVDGGNGAPFGDGLLCVGGTLHRIGSATASGGVASYPQPGHPAIHLRGAVEPGRYVYQARYRNVAGPCGTQFNTTNALDLIWTP